MSENLLSTDHFWIGSVPYFNPYLIVFPQEQDFEPSETLIDFFDCDGEPFNSAKIIVDTPKVQCISLEPFLSGCKTESGMKHCHLRSTSSLGTEVFCRLHSHLQTTLLGHAQSLNETLPGFFPLTLEEGVTNLLAIMNVEEQVASLKLRLYVGNRNPEITVSIAPNGSALVHLENEFKDVIEALAQKSTRQSSYQGYVRILAKSPLAIQMLTKEVGPQEQPQFSALG
jgi:hypothetical protein